MSSSRPEDAFHRDQKPTHRCVLCGAPAALYTEAGFACRDAGMRLHLGAAFECEVLGCERRGPGRQGLCSLHYRRWKRTGSTGLIPKFATWEDRFWAKVNKSGPVPEYAPTLGNCWDWAASCNESRGGYGQFSLHGRVRKAHQVAWEITQGAIPSGLVLDHLCRRPVCVNPSHLEPVSTGENTIRGTGSNMLTHRQKICQRGHEQTPANTVTWPSYNGIMCRICYNLRHQARFDAALKASLVVSALVHMRDSYPGPKPAGFVPLPRPDQEEAS